MPHQIALTVIAKIKSGETGNLKKLLGTIHENRGKKNIISFEKFSNIHFARLMVLDEAKDLYGNLITPSLAFLTNFDAPLHKHLEDLATIAAEELDQIYSYCEGYPAVNERTPENRLAFLRSHTVWF